MALDSNYYDVEYGLQKSENIYIMFLKVLQMCGENWSKGCLQQSMMSDVVEIGVLLCGQNSDASQDALKMAHKISLILTAC